VDVTTVFWISSVGIRRCCGGGVMCVFRNKLNAHALWEEGEEENAAVCNKME